MASERIEYPEREATDESLQEFALGKNHMDAGRHDLEQRGMSSGSMDYREYPFNSEDPLTQPHISVEQSSIVSQEKQEDFDYKRAYGNSENEKGQWRKTANDAISELNKLKMEMDVMRRYTPQVTQTATTSAPIKYVDGKEDDDLMYAKDVEEVIHRWIAPAYQHLAAQTQALAQAQLSTMKSAAGITPTDEMELAAKYPWVANLPEGHQKIEALRTLKQTSQPSPPQPRYDQVRPTVNRITYVESNKHSPSDSTLTPQQLFDREMKEAMQKPWGAQRRVAMEEVFRKYGINHKNDFRASDILSR